MTKRVSNSGKALGRLDVARPTLCASCLRCLRGGNSSSGPRRFDPPGAVTGQGDVACHAGRVHSRGCSVACGCACGLTDALVVAGLSITPSTHQPPPRPQLRSRCVSRAARTRDEPFRYCHLRRSDLAPLVARKWRVRNAFGVPNVALGLAETGQRSTVVVGRPATDCKLVGDIRLMALELVPVVEVL